MFKKEEIEKEEEQSREMRERCERDEIERSFFQQPHAVETSKNIVAAVAYSNVVHCRKFTYLLPLLCPCMFTRTSSAISNTKAKLGKKLNKILKLNINIWQDLARASTSHFDHTT